jgi:hypothetical protein
VKEWIGEADRLSLSLSRHDCLLLLTASLFPVLVVALVVYRLGYEIDNNNYLIGFPPSAWLDLYRFAGTTIEVASYLGMGILFLHGAARISRGVGTWALLAALSLAAFAAASGLYGGLYYLTANLSEFDTRSSWHLEWALTAAEHLGFLAVGYAYLAYRGLATEPEPVAAESGS